MNRTDYDNALRRQCMSLPDLCEDQIAGVRKGLAASLTDDQLRSSRRIIITGCGDSLMAAKAAIPAFKKFAGAFASNFYAIPAIDVARYMSFDPVYSSTTLVIGVSCSGSPARMVEVLRRAKAKGCMTLAVTNNPDSQVAKEAGATLIVYTPAFPDSDPGLRNYYASLVGLYSLAAKMGEVTGRSKSGTIDKLAQAIRTYTAAYAPVLEAIDEQMFQLAQIWQDFDAYDFIGDDIEFCSAYFGGAKIVEVAGNITCTEDSENWCHVNYFFKNPTRIGTTVIADVFANNRSRITETLRQAAGIGRPLMLVTNGTGLCFEVSKSIQVCCVPKAPVGYEFLLPLMNYVPSAILAGYISRLNGEAYFRGGVWNEEGNNTIRNSEICVL